MTFYSSVSISSLIWPLDNNDLIDIASDPIGKQSFEIYNSTKIYREEEETIIEKIKEDNKHNSSKDEYRLKLAEIIKKNSKFYYKPNKKANYYPNFNDGENINNAEFLSFLIYKSSKTSENKNKYRIKEGDVLKLGREWLFIKEIYISNITKQKLRMKKKEKLGNINKLFMNNSQANKELNINDDFKIFEYNETEEDKNIDIDIVNKTKKYITEDEECKLNIKEIILKDENKSNKKQSENNEDKNKNKKIKLCRVCYLEESDNINNPLIKPCKCAGSMKYIHYECLLHWLKTKITDKSSRFYTNDYLSVFCLKLIECELCKTRLPDYIRHNNEIYSLLNLDINFESDTIIKKKNKTRKSRKEYKYNYIIFDSITPKNNEDNKFRFLVKFNENNILKIGRGLEMQLILNDISVSRNHCQLVINDDGDVILEDKGSRFSSLVLIQEEIEILKGQKLNVQVGTNYLTLNLNKKTGLFSCCNAEEIDNKNTYEKLNSLAIKYNKYNGIVDESISNENSDNEEENKQLIENEKESEKNSNEIVIYDINKRNRNQRNKLNMNNDLNYNESTLMLKDNRIKDKNDISTNKISNLNKIREEFTDINNKILKEIKSENIIISEEDIKISNFDKEIKSHKIKENN